MCAVEECVWGIICRLGLLGKKCRGSSGFFQNRGSSLALLCEQQASDEVIFFFKLNTRRISVESFDFYFYLLYLHILTKLFMKHTTASLVQVRVTASCCDVFKLPFIKVASDWATIAT